MARAAKGERKTLHISLPEKDTVALKWLEAQNNVSASIRLLIIQQAAEAGFEDVFDLIMANPPKRRGRPPQTVTPAWAEEEGDEVVEVEVAPVQPTVAAKPVVSNPVTAAQETETHVEITTDDPLDSLPSLGAMGTRRTGSADRGDALKAMLDA